MKVTLVACLLVAEVFYVLAIKSIDSKLLDSKNVEDFKSNNTDISHHGKSSTIDRRRDTGHYYSRPNRFTSSNHNGFGRQSHRERIRLQSKVNRPFNQYGPPNYNSQSFGHQNNQLSTNNFNQEVPSPIRNVDFVQESPIASQNNQPFGQHTANYLPPQNQKLPAPKSPQLFSNANHDFPRQNQLNLQQEQQQFQQQNFEHQQQQFEQQQQQFEQQQQFYQQQQYHQQQQQFEQLQQPLEQQQQQQQQQFEQLQQPLEQHQQQQQQQLILQQQFGQQQQFEQQQQYSFDNQNNIGQDFNIPNQNFAQNEFGQISDAALFLTQNAQAISNLYHASAPNNQEFQPLNQYPQQNQLNFDVQIDQNEPSQETSNQSPSSASGSFKSQDTLIKIQSLEKDRIIAQLQQELSSRESASRNAEQLNYQQSQNQGYVQQQQSFAPTSVVSSEGYQGFYAPAVTTTSQPPISSTSHIITTTQQPSHASTGAGSTHVGTNVPAPENFRPSVLNSQFSQYGGFTPTFVAQGFIPSVPNYGTTLLPAVSVKPVDTAPTHFAIPIPPIQEQKPILPPLTSIPAPSTPALNPVRPNPPTLTVSVGPSHHPVVTPAQTPIIHPIQTPANKPNPIPGLPAAVPVHPTYGFQPTYVYKPVKPVYKPVYPVYLYPNLAYKSGHKVISHPTSIHPWNYAPSYKSPGSWR